MRNGLVLVVSIVTALVVAFLAADAVASTGSFIGTEPVAVVVFLTIGIALPQYVIYRWDGGDARLGLAALSVAAAVVILLSAAVYYYRTGSPFDAPLMILFQYAVIGALLGGVVRAFLAGYRERTA